LTEEEEEEEEEEPKSNFSKWQKHKKRVFLKFH